jgi:SAM-dependent methyltransferase
VVTGDPGSSREQRLVFGEVADAYDLRRPSYPSEVIDGVLAFAGLEHDTTTPVAEIGAGTGKASVLFAARGISLECLEPSREMAAVARRNLAAYPNAEVRGTSFEDWRPAPHRHGLVFAAQSWHWVSPEGRYAKLHRALRPQGSFAALWNVIVSRGDSALEKDLEAAYGDLEVGRWKTAEADRSGVNDWVMSEIEASGQFEPGSLQVLRRPWRRSYGTDDWLGLLSTQSDHRMLDEQTRADLFGRIRAAVERNGGSVEVDYVTVAFMVRTSAGNGKP